ncbi:MAG: ATP-binding cassette domain-containing protein [Ruminococcus sp.]
MKISELRGRSDIAVPQSYLISGPAHESVGGNRSGEREGEKGQKKLIGIVPQVWSALEENGKLKHPLSECSGGMTRRILLSTALMENPKLIIADEPTPGMQAWTAHLRKKSMEDFRKFCR